MQLAVRDRFLAAPYIHDLFDGHKDFLDILAHLLKLHALLDAFLHLVLLTGERMNDEPLAFHGVPLSYPR